MEPTATHLVRSGFEGSEKKLEIHFGSCDDLRQIGRDVWVDILNDACCSIINEVRGSAVTAYLLSESSLFVSESTIMLKTCGVTGLLHCVSKLLETTARFGAIPSFVKYSRAMFSYPEEQPYPHQCFSLEVEYLDAFFDGQGYILGPMEGFKWHVYVAQIARCEQKSTFEMVMYDIPDAIAQRFFLASYPDISDNLAHHVTNTSGIQSIYPSATIDAFMFQPCGYSCNGILPDGSFFTIHITPEPNNTFISFDTNATSTSRNKIIEKLTNIFCPSDFSICSFASSVKSLETISIDTPGTYMALYQSSHDVPGTCAIAFSTYHTCTDQSDRSFRFDLNLPLSKVSLLSSRERCSRALEASQMKTKICSTCNVHSSKVPSLLKEIITKKATNDAFVMVDLAKIVRQMEAWVTLFPYVQPFFSVSQTMDKSVLLALASTGCSFKCVSIAEMRLLHSLGIASARTLLNHPFKSMAHLRVARDCGISMMTACSSREVKLIADVCPHASVLMCLNTHICKERELLRCFDEAKQLNLDVVGVTLDRELVPSFDNLAPLLKRACSLLLSVFGKEHCIVDFEHELIQQHGEKDSLLFHEAVAQVTQKHFTLYATPSAYLVKSSSVVAVNILEVSKTPQGYDYIVNDGYKGNEVDCYALAESRSQTRHRSRLLVPTDAGIKQIVVGARLPLLKEGQWIYLENIGDQHHTLAPAYNSYSPILSHYVFT